LTSQTRTGNTTHGTCASSLQTLQPKLDQTLNHKKHNSPHVGSRIITSLQAQPWLWLHAFE
jgi:hypothetical protein